MRSVDAAIRRGNLEAAHGLLEETLSQDRANPDVHFWTGVVYSQRGLLQDAVTSFNESIRLSDDAQAHCSLADVLDGLGDEDGAIHHYRIATTMDPANSQAFTNLGVVLARRGELDAALTCYSTAITLEPDSAVAHYGMGRLLRMMGDLSGAARSFHLAVLFEGWDADYHMALGGALDELRLPHEALVHYRKAARIDPGRAECNYAIGAEARIARFKSVAVTCSDEPCVE